jgi:hypothetical protein
MQQSIIDGYAARNSSIDYNSALTLMGNSSAYCVSAFAGSKYQITDSDLYFSYLTYLTYCCVLL